MRTLPLVRMLGMAIILGGATVVCSCGGDDDVQGTDTDGDSEDGGDAGNGVDAGDEMDDDVEVAWTCATEMDAGEVDFLNQIGCERDFAALAAQPTDSSLPGAMTVKTIIDRVMDVEFKFDGEPGETPELAVKQARPHPGR